MFNQTLAGIQNNLTVILASEFMCCGAVSPPVTTGTVAAGVGTQR